MKEIRVKPKELKIERFEQWGNKHWTVGYNLDNGVNQLLANIKQNPNNKNVYRCDYYGQLNDLSPFGLENCTLTDVIEQIQTEWTEYCMSTIPNNFEIIEIIDNENN